MGQFESPAVDYLPPFEILKSCVKVATLKGELTVSCRYDAFVEMIRRLLVCIEVDEAWYLQRYPDVAEAVRAGTIPDARTHFVSDGYFEGRQPFPIHVDEAWYLRQNDGVADYVRRGLLESGQQHFDQNGYTEGRLPFAL